MAYGDFKDLARGTSTEKILCNKAYDIPKNLKYDGYQRDLTSMVYQFFDKKSVLLVDKSVSASGMKNENMSNKELAKELHKPIIRTFQKRKVYSSFMDNIWGADLADMQLTSKFTTGIHILLCVIDIIVNTHGLFLQKIKKILQLLKKILNNQLSK